jgi:hypothetical protein
MFLQVKGKKRWVLEISEYLTPLPSAVDSAAATAKAEDMGK